MLDGQRMESLLAYIGSVVLVPWPKHQDVRVRMRVVDVAVDRGRASLVVVPIDGGDTPLRIRKWARE